MAGPLLASLISASRRQTLIPPALLAAAPWPQLYVVFSREERLKVTFLQTRGFLTQDYKSGPLSMTGVRHAVAVAACVMLSVIVADAAVALGWRYDCP
jgi:hypothetical protein